MFQNRQEAGRLLAEKLGKYRGERGVVLAIPRGGVVIGKVIAQELGWPLEVVVVKKIGAPGNPELAIGAVGEGGVKVIDWEMALRLGVEQEQLDRQVQSAKCKVQSYVKRFRDGRQLVIGHWSLVIIIDDGVATGATVEAGIKAIQLQIQRVYKRELELTGRKKSKKSHDRYKKLTTQKLILAIPVGARETVVKLRKLVDELIVLEEPLWFSAVGEFYREFPEIKDEEVIEILNSKQ